MLAIIVAWVHRGALDAGFVFDDRPRILEVEESIDALWPPSAWLDGTPRPMVRFTLALNHAVGGLEPRGYHVFNVGVHVASSVMVVLLIVAAGRRLRERGLVSIEDRGLLLVGLTSAVLWACHPVQTATATYVIQRAESLMAFFSLAATWALVRGCGASRPGGWWICVLGSVLLAMASKPVAVVLPFLLLLVDATVVAGTWRAAVFARPALHGGTFAVAFAMLVWTGTLEGLLGDGDGRTGAGAGVVGIGPIEYAVSQVGAIGLYARILVDPAAMSIDHGLESLAPAWTRNIGIVVLAMFAATIVIGLVRRAWWTVLPAAAVLVLAPTSSVVPLADPVADHRLHLALLPVVIGLVAVVAAGRSGLTHRLPRSAPWSLAVLSIAFGIALVFGARGIATRNLDYQDPDRLWSDVIARRPDHVRALVNRAGTALEEARFEDAARDLAAAADLEPGNPVLLVNLALVDLEAGRFDSAIERLVVARAARADDPVLHLGLGDAYRAVGRPSDAVDSYRVAIEILPGDAAARLALGNAFADLERLSEAAETFAAAAELAREPRLAASGRYNEANMWFRLGRFDDAVAAYEAALVADPGHERARRWLEEARAARER